MVAASAPGTSSTVASAARRYSSSGASELRSCFMTASMAISCRFSVARSRAAASDVVVATSVRRCVSVQGRSCPTRVSARRAVTCEVASTMGTMATERASLAPLHTGAVTASWNSGWRVLHAVASSPAYGRPVRSSAWRSSDRRPRTARVVKRPWVSVMMAPQSTSSSETSTSSAPPTASETPSVSSSRWLSCASTSCSALLRASSSVVFSLCSTSSTMRTKASSDSWTSAPKAFLPSCSRFSTAVTCSPSLMGRASSLSVGSAPGATM